MVGSLILSIRINRTVLVEPLEKPRRRMSFICTIWQQIWSVMISHPRLGVKFLDWTALPLREVHLLPRMTVHVLLRMPSMRNLVIWLKIQTILIILILLRSEFTTG